MTARPIPTRHWRSYGTEPLPTGREALEEPFRAFPSWFMRVTCGRCGQQRMFSETHSPQGDMLIRDIIARMPLRTTIDVIQRIRPQRRIYNLGVKAPKRRNLLL